MSSPGPAMIAATEAKMIGRVTQIGGPEVVRLVKKMTEESCRSTVTGYAEMKPISPISVTGEYSGGPRRGFPARRNPRPMPRNDPSSTKLLK